MTQDAKALLVEWFNRNIKSVKKYYYDAVEYWFNIGDATKRGFRIKLSHSKAHSFGEDVPYNIFIYQFHKKDDPSVLEMPGFTINVDWDVLPEPIHPQKDERFSSQEWSKQFFLWENNQTYSCGEFDFNTICDILKFCHQLHNLQSFL